MSSHFLERDSVENICTYINVQKNWKFFHSTSDCIHTNATILSWLITIR